MPPPVFSDCSQAIEPPRELKPFPYFMSWHPQLTNEPAHVWLGDRFGSRLAAFATDHVTASSSWVNTAGEGCLTRLTYFRGIGDTQNPTGSNLLQNVNPIFEWVRLAQRIPVRIKLISVPKDTILSSGMTVTVSIIQEANSERRALRRSNESCPESSGDFTNKN